MKMKQLEYLIKIAECGSISKAAQELYISQPSLTKAISAITLADYSVEDALDVFNGDEDFKL